MCRQFARAGLAGNGATRGRESLAPALYRGPTSMEALSRPGEGGGNDSGYGLYQRDDNRWNVARSPLPAYASNDFRRTVAQMDAAHAARHEGDSFVDGCHVRFATVGAVAKQNCHPFRMSGPAGETVWTMNGNVARFEEERERILAEMAPEYAAQIRGGTDTEAALAIYLTRLDGMAKNPRRPEAEEVAHALADTVETLARIANVPDGEKSFMNFVATNGEYLGVTRYRNSLVVGESVAPDGGLALEHGARTNGLVVASQPWAPGLELVEFPEATAGVWTPHERSLVLRPMGNETLLPIGDPVREREALKQKLLAARDEPVVEG